MFAVRSLLTLATTMGESEVAGAPSIVEPDTRVTTGTPSRRTVRLTAAFLPTRASNAALVAGNVGSGGGSTVVLVVVLLVVVVLVVAVLVVLGGLGPPVVQALPRWVRRQPLPLHARLVIWTTMVLAFPPALLLLAVEWGNTLRGMGPGARVANALFLAVTPRTAGFNSVATAAVKPATLWITMVLMFLGGSPGSTAGGIKTTTVALLTLVILAALRGRTHVRAFGFRVSQRSVYRAAAVTVLALLTMGTVVVVLQLTQEMPLDMAAFESLSALGTVGLSIGGTERLDAVGKLIVGVTMFTGRVGPLTLFMFLSARTASDRFELPEEEVAVG